MINDLMMPIETILKLNYDKLKRDELGIVQYSCVCRSDCHSCTEYLPPLAGDCPRALPGKL